MTTLREAVAAAQARLRAGAIDQPALDARLLVQAAAAATREDLVVHSNRVLDDAQRELLETFVKRRLLREPVAHILGKKSFWTFELAVTSATLVPRADTESLVAAALEFIAPDADVNVVDLGVGSGAIAIAIASERPRARVTGVDLSEEALEVARLNVHAMQLTDRIVLIKDDWGASLPLRAADMIVANPPYLTRDDWERVEPEVRREPRLALVAGEDGLDAYRVLVPRLKALLKPAGAFALEVGLGQAASVSALAEAAGLQLQGTRRDLAGIERVVIGRSAEKA